MLTSVEIFGTSWDGCLFKLHRFSAQDIKKKVDYVLKIEGTDKYKGWPYSQAIYFTEGMVFAQTSDNKLISWKLLENGKSEYYNAKQTQEMLDSGLAKKLGLTKNKSGSTFYFGEFNITSGYGPNYSKIKDEPVH